MDLREGTGNTARIEGSCSFVYVLMMETSVGSCAEAQVPKIEVSLVCEVLE